MISNYETLQQFTSETKNVALINYNGGKAILKLFPDNEALEKEAELMQKIAMTGYAPKLYLKESNYLICEHIEGKSFREAFVLATMLEDAEALETLAQQLSIFLQIFHSVSNKILGTIDFNNILIRDDRCVGISFVGTREGLPYEDVAAVTAYAIANTVGDLYSCVPFIAKLLKSFHLNMMDIINDLSTSLDVYDKKHILDKRAVLDACINFDEHDIAWDLLK